jgi:hypothetical protein
MTGKQAGGWLPADSWRLTESLSAGFRFDEEFCVSYFGEFQKRLFVKLISR